MNNQEVFDTVWTHFIIEKNPHSVGPDGYCRYRGVNGGKCAVGLLIPDSEYYPGLEEVNIYDVYHRVPSLRDSSVSPALLRDLQYAHDTQYKTLEDGLRRLAHTYDLTIPGETA